MLYQPIRLVYQSNLYKKYVMKKIIAALVVLLAVVAGVSAQVKQLDSKSAFYIYLKETKTKISDKEYLNYAKSVEYATYRKYKDDEFEWQDQFAQIKKKFDDAIASASTEGTYCVNTAVEFGDYDFANEKWPVSIGEGTFFPLRSVNSSADGSADSGSIIRNQIALSLDGLSKYNGFKMPKEEAKNFLKGRKSSSGYVNREVTISIAYKIASFDSKEYKDFASYALDHDYIPIVGIIDNIEVYDKSDSRNVKKIGMLTKD